MSVMEMFSSPPIVLIFISKMAIACSLAVIKGCNAWTILSDICTEKQREFSILVFSYFY